jgi:flagellar motility protein MotE (MotC chaperone)
MTGEANMRLTFAALIFAMGILGGVSYAADEPSSLGAQVGEAAKQLQGTADESLSTGAMKVTETSKKLETEIQDTLKVLQQQWDALAKQLQEKTRQIQQQLQKQLQQQLQDFNKSFNAPKQ